jgi:primary-amine oxidase
MAEMIVPYGDPGPTHYRKNVLDEGEHGLGMLANSLQLGCDCLGHIHYFDAVMSNGRGEPITIPNAICMHEEDVGVLWKHTDWRTNQVETRRSRRLVLSFFATVGHYDYGFFWYFYQDGNIGYEVKLTGIMNSGAVAEGVIPKHGRLVAPGVNALIHQHFFNVRLDMTVDGKENSVYEVETRADPIGPSNPHGNAFYAVATALTHEQEAQRLIDPLHGRYWVVVNPEITNSLGQLVGYKLMPGDNVLAFAQPESWTSQRAGFIHKHLWVTPYTARERYPAGEYPNQSAGGDGLPTWTQANRSIEQTDIVVWYTFGAHHIPRTEDWPVMPVTTVGFHLKPVGFFERNPALDVPPSPAEHDEHCAH